MAFATLPDDRPEPPQRNEKPREFDLPLARWEHDGTWGFRASALVPDEGAPTAVRWWRKKFQVNRVEMINRTINTRGLQTGDRNVPMPLILTHTLTGWAFGDMDGIRDLIGRLRYVGKARGMGIGRIVSVSVGRAEADYSCARDGAAMRHLHAPGAWRQCRPRPPYWSNVGRVPVCEVWDPVPDWWGGNPPPAREPGEIDFFDAMTDDGDIT